MPSTTCRRCRAPLTNKRSIENGIGPWCARQEIKDTDQMDIINDPKPIPGNPTVDGVIIRRDPVDNAIATNVPRVAVHHSPTGFEVGYAGSGPADFALNIMAMFAPVANEDDATKARNGFMVSKRAWKLYQQFKRDYLMNELAPGMQLHISADEVRAWISREINNVGV